MALGGEPLRVAVVGAGRMGENHLRIYNGLKNVHLVGLVDPDRARAAAAAARYDCTAFASIDELVGKVDAASVCVPSGLHAAVGCFLLDNGIDCLIEKPLAVSERECEALIAAAHQRNRILMVGHVERFNPAVQELANLLGNAYRVHAIDARRMSWTGTRVADTDVVLDLMVHDLDIVLWLMGKPVRAVSASGVHTSNARGQDYVTALLSFDDGEMASLTASRITETKVRELLLTTDLGYITVNYVSQEVLVFRQGGTKREPHHWSNTSSAVLDSVIERVVIRNAEPLVLELQHFVACVRAGTVPMVTGQNALDTLRVAHRIQADLARYSGNG